MMARLQGILLALALLASAGMAAHGHAPGHGTPAFEQAQERLERDCEQCRVGSPELGAAITWAGAANAERGATPRLRAAALPFPRVPGQGPRAPPFSS